MTMTQRVGTWVAATVLSAALASAASAQEPPRPVTATAQTATPTGGFEQGDQGPWPVDHRRAEPGRLPGGSSRVQQRARPHRTGSARRLARARLLRRAPMGDQALDACAGVRPGRNRLQHCRVHRNGNAPSVLVECPPSDAQRRKSRVRPTDGHCEIRPCPARVSAVSTRTVPVPQHAVFRSDNHACIHKPHIDHAHPRCRRAARRSDSLPQFFLTAGDPEEPEHDDDASSRNVDGGDSSGSERDPGSGGQRAGAAGGESGAAGHAGRRHGRGNQGARSLDRRRP